MNRLSALPALALAFVALGCGSKEPEVASKTPPPAAPKGTDRKDGGTARIDIKHATDPDAASINTKPKDITVEDLIATKLPADFKGGLTDYNDKRIGDFEKSTYRISGTLKSVIHRKDGDYFLVMQGKTGATAVVEVPDPALATGSPLIKDMQAVRTEIENKYHPTDTAKDINEPATIEGVGFYGTRKPGSGGRASLPRLMPSTGIKLGK